MTQPQPWGHAVARLGGASLAALHGFEGAARRLHPPRLARLREVLTPVAERLREALRRFRAERAPEGLADFHDHLREAAELVEEALAAFLETPPPERAVLGILEALHRHCEAQRAFYALRCVLPPLGRYFVEPAFHERLDRLDPEPPEGVTVGLLEAPGRPEGVPPGAQRGGFTLYVPERYDGSRELPLVVALHGGGGHGRDFVWTWLREARGREFLLLAPTSRGPTWSLDQPRLDGERLGAVLELVAGRYRVDRTRVLATGLSDGASFALLWGLSEASPVTAIAPVSGVLHPAHFALGNPERARGRPVYLVHGSLDWLFPVGLARRAREALEGAGAHVVYREIEDLSHTYPREENDRILAWFDPRLSLPQP